MKPKGKAASAVASQSARANTRIRRGFIFWSTSFPHAHDSVPSHRSLTDDTNTNRRMSGRLSARRRRSPLEPTRVSAALQPFQGVEGKLRTGDAGGAPDSSPTLLPPETRATLQRLLQRFLGERCLRRVRAKFVVASAGRAQSVRPLDHHTGVVQVSELRIASNVWQSTS